MLDMYSDRKEVIQFFVGAAFGLGVVVVALALIGVGLLIENPYLQPVYWAPVLLLFGFGIRHLVNRKETVKKEHES